MVVGVRLGIGWEFVGRFRRCERFLDRKRPKCGEGTKLNYRAMFHTAITPLRPCPRHRVSSIVLLPFQTE